MLTPPLPANETERLQALRALDILDTPAEEQFDRLTRIAKYILQVPITLVSLVDAKRQWFKSRQGLNVTETPREISFCGHTILGNEVFLVPDAIVDVRFSDNPLVTEAPNIRFYVGVPLTLSGGLNVGTLCAIDYQPRQISIEQLAVLRDLAQCVVAELERIQRRQYVKDLALIRARYAAIIESSHDAIISKTMDGIITSWNPAAEKLFGYSAQEAMGRSITMIIPKSNLYEEQMLLSSLRKGERIEHFETIRTRKDESLVEVSVSVSPIVDKKGVVIGASKVVHDISEKNNIKIALQESALLVKSIVETVVDGIITIDGRGKVLSFNISAERIFGYKKNEIIGRNVNCLMPEPYTSEHDGYLANYLSTKKAKIISIGREVVGRRKDGSTFPMDLAVSEMKQADQTLFVGIVRDITERKQVERMKGEFVSTVSHELRTPLTSIRGALGLLIGRFSASLSDKARQLLETANRNAERLTLLINDILDLEKIESGQLDFKFQTLDLVAITHQAIIANEGYGQQHNVGMRLVDTLDSANIWGDEHRLLQVFANLLSNAIKYSITGGTVEVAVRRHDGRFP